MRGRIMGSISAALIGLGGGDVGKWVDGIFRRDLDRQKTQLLKKKTAAGVQANLYSQMLQAHGDERLAEAATLRAMYQEAEDKLNEIATSGAS